MAHQHSSSCGCGKPVNSCNMPAATATGKSSGSTKQFRTHYDEINWGNKSKAKKAESKK